jgi:hypothetical protein
MSDRKQREGQQLGNYRIIQLLGQGNWASVYLGQHIHLNTLAAIKVLHEHLATHDVTDFLNEARAIARLRHPHIIQVLDFGIEGMTPFLVMDYAPGGNLRKLHPKGGATPTRHRGFLCHTGGPGLAVCTPGKADSSRRQAREPAAWTQQRGLAFGLWHCHHSSDFTRPATPVRRFRAYHLLLNTWF